MQLPDRLAQALQSQLASTSRRELRVHCLRSRPHRSHALFPWASAPSRNRVLASELLVIVSEEGVPTFALEASFYVLPATSTLLVYIAKVDTTGLLDPAVHSSPARALVAAFIEHHLSAAAGPDVFHCQDVRIHVFARAQDQYIFPGSIDNPTKKARKLDDRGLLRWWKNVLGSAAPPDARLFYLLGGYDDAAESRAEVPIMPGERWKYGHPYNTLRPVLLLSAEPEATGEAGDLTINDLIPAFSDDPKSRFLTSLASSPIPAAGEKDDYDDVYSELHRITIDNASLGAAREAELVAAVARERSRLQKVEGKADEFWIRMGVQQECKAGYVVGFFVVSVDHGRPPSDPPAPMPFVHAGALPRHDYVSLWSKLHNVDYSSLEKVKAAQSQWVEDVQEAVKRYGGESVDVAASVTIEASAKRKTYETPVAPEAQPMMLKPRKKARPA